MNNSKSTKLSNLMNIKKTVESYEEIAAMRMRRVKMSVLDNREFLKELSELFNTVKKAEKTLLRQKEKISDKKGTVMVLLSSNTGLYGSVIRDVFDKFYADSLTNSKSDIIIVGRLGRKFYEDSKDKRSYEYFNFSDSGKDEKNLDGLIEKLKSYEHVIVYHSKFKDILKQEVNTSYITGADVVSNSEKTADGLPIIDYIYEPNTKEISDFFENQIIALLFEQSVFESSLSKFASRMISLDSAVVNVNKQLKREVLIAFRESHYMKNKSQQNLISSISIWNN